MKSVRRNVGTSRRERGRRPVLPDLRQAADAGPAKPRRNVLAPVALSVLVAALALLLVWQRLRVVQFGYVLSSAAKLERRLEGDNRELKIELATLTAPGRLESMARERLGLKEPRQEQVVQP